MLRASASMRRKAQNDLEGPRLKGSERYLDLPTIRTPGSDAPINPLLKACQGEPSPGVTHSPGPARPFHTDPNEGGPILNVHNDSLHDALRISTTAASPEPISEGKQHPP